MKKYMVLAVSPLAFASCAFDPGNKDLDYQSAVRQMVSGINVLTEPPPPGQKHIGLVPSEVTGVFAVTKSSQGDLKLNLSASGGAVGSAGFATDNSNSFQRVNTVTIKLVNVWIDKDGKYRPPVGSRHINPEYAAPNKKNKKNKKKDDQNPEFVPLGEWEPITPYNLHLKS